MDRREAVWSFFNRQLYLLYILKSNLKHFTSDYLLISILGFCPCFLHSSVLHEWGCSALFNLFVLVIEPLAANIKPSQHWSMIYPFGITLTHSGSYCWHWYLCRYLLDIFKFFIFPLFVLTGPPGVFKVHWVQFEMFFYKHKRDLFCLCKIFWLGWIMLSMYFHKRLLSFPPSSQNSARDSAVDITSGFRALPFSPSLPHSGPGQPTDTQVNEPGHGSALTGQHQEAPGYNFP